MIKKYLEFRGSVCVFPTNSESPSLCGDIAPYGTMLLRWVSEQCKSVCVEFEKAQILMPSDVHRHLSHLYKVFYCASDITLTLTQNETIELNTDFDGRTSGFQNSKYWNYDKYFNIVRYDHASPMVFIDQLLLVCRNQFHDLIHSQVALSELTIALKGTCKMYELLCSELDGQTPNTVTWRLNDTVQPLSIKSPGEHALHRWKLGHYFYACFLMFSKTELRKAISSEITSTVQCIENAALLFRSSTTAMWLASIFSAQMYIEVVRPSMMSTHTPGGFTGKHNRDFMNWKSTKDDFFHHFGQHIPVSTAVLAALKDFVDKYLQDGEQHILLAAAMVGDKCSLTLEDAQINGTTKNSESAVEMLRFLLGSRHREVKSIIQIKKNKHGKDLRM